MGYAILTAAFAGVIVGYVIGRLSQMYHCEQRGHRR